MENNKVSGNKEVWISYKEDNDNIVNGFVILLELSDTLIKFKTGKNIIVLPISRLIKMKEKAE